MSDENKTAQELAEDIDKTLSHIISNDDYTAAQRAEFYATLHKDDPKTDREWLQYASSLPSMEYDRQREAIAKRLGIRVGTLDEEIDKTQSKVGRRRWRRRGRRYYPI